MADAEMPEESPRVRPFNPIPMDDYTDEYVPSEQETRLRELIMRAPLYCEFPAASQLNLNYSSHCNESSLSIGDQSCDDSLEEVIQNWRLLHITDDVLPPAKRAPQELPGQTILNPEAYSDQPASQPALELSPDDFLADVDIARFEGHLGMITERKVDP